MTKKKKKIGVSRSVTHRPGYSISHSLASEALARERHESRVRYNEHISGLSRSTLRTLQNNTINPCQDTTDAATSDDNMGDWQDIVDDVIGGGPEGSVDNGEDVDDIVYDLRDIVTSRWKSRWFTDHRTWRLRRERFDKNWEVVMPDIVTAYLAWRKSQVSTMPAPSLQNPVPHDPAYDFTLDAIDIYTLPTTLSITRSANTSASAALVDAGYLGNTPLSPSLAISLKTLELLRVIRLHRPSFSIEAFARVICYFYLVPYRRKYRTALSDTFDVYLDLRRRVDAQVATFLGRDGADYRVLHACPPCSYKIQGEPELRYERMIVLDGNNSLKRIKAIGNRQISDKRTFESDYFLPAEFVDQYANEVKARPAAPANKSSEAEDDEPDTPVLEGEGDPTDGAGDIDSGPSGCTDNWKAAAKEENKKMWAIFSESGIFASACRHGFILWLTDMISSGELAKYPIAIIAKALQTLKTRLLVGYDIGCRFDTTLSASSLGPAFKASKCRFCVNAFHGYSHNYLCQLYNHPNAIEGMGIEDLETLERVFSASNSLGAVTRYMTADRRRIFINLHFHHWDHEKYANLANMLHDNYRQSLAIIETHSLDIQHVLDSRQLDESAILEYIDNERTFFSTLGKEPDDDLHAIAYAEALQELWAVESKLDDVTSLFRTQTPADYHFISPELSYSTNLSETRRTDTARRQLTDRRDTLLLDLSQSEDKMNIHTRWTPDSPQYRQVAEYIANRKYERALDHLQSLVIKRLFELHKLNLSQTGYRMRTHIAKSLQTRSKTIRAAVSRYNSLAVPLGRPTLDWTKVTHYSFLDDFNILRHTRTDINKRPWADPVIRETMRKYQRLQRAKEEIIRCNIELRRLHSSVMDENNSFDQILRSLEGCSHVLEVEIREFISRRLGVNQRLLARIYDTYSLKGFTGDPTPGNPVTPLPPPNFSFLRSEDATSMAIDDETVLPPEDGNDFSPLSQGPPSAPIDMPNASMFHDAGTTSGSESGDELADEEIGDIGGLVDFISHIS
ncbi:hypothetical protein H0H92_000329 [Tricholoma furcatifolium]|nr:hypothetical protein H0H92_000329 [Tricholoma furcatifolium]